MLHAASGDGARTDIPWLPSLGVDLVLRLDGLSWLFALLIIGIGALIVLYARYYMSSADPVPRFYSYLLAFMGAMLGIVMSGNLIQLVVFWELTSLFSFLLIGYWHQNPNAREGARMALTVTGAGGLCLLVGMLLLGEIVGSYDLDVVLTAGDAIRAHSLYLPALLLISNVSAAQTTVKEIRLTVHNTEDWRFVVTFIGFSVAGRSVCPALWRRGRRGGTRSSSSGRRRTASSTFRAPMAQGG